MSVCTCYPIAGFDRPTGLQCHRHSAVGMGDIVGGSAAVAVVADIVDDRRPDSRSDDVAVAADQDHQH